MTCRRSALRRAFRAHLASVVLIVARTCNKCNTLYTDGEMMVKASATLSLEILDVSYAAHPERYRSRPVCEVQRRFAVQSSTAPPHYADQRVLSVRLEEILVAIRRSGKARCGCCWPRDICLARRQRTGLR